MSDVSGGSERSIDPDMQDRQRHKPYQRHRHHDDHEDGWNDDHGCDCSCSHDDLDDMRGQVRSVAHELHEANREFALNVIRTKIRYLKTLKHIIKTSRGPIGLMGLMLSSVAGGAVQEKRRGY